MTLIKPQAYAGITCNEEVFSEEFDRNWKFVVKNLSEDSIMDIKELVYQAYKEGYADAWEKAVFMMR